MRVIALWIGLLLFSGYLQAELRHRTETVRGEKPRITSTVEVFNYSMRGWPPKVGDDVRHFMISASDPDGDAVSTRVEWLRDGEIIAGATALTYKPVAADIGKKLSVRMYVWTNSAITDPSQGDTRTSAELAPVQGSADLYSPDPIYFVSAAKTDAASASAACTSNGDRIATALEMQRTYVQSTSATTTGVANNDMCTSWSWGLSGQCGGASDTYWALNGSSNVAVNMRSGSIVSGGTHAVACVKK